MGGVGRGADERIQRSGEGCATRRARARAVLTFGVWFGWVLLDIDINNLTTIALVAEAAVARMQTWYEDGVFE